MPSTTSSSVSRLFASSTVMTPSLPTFFMASASMRPISTSPFAEIVPTCAISSLLATFFERFCTSATPAPPRRESRCRAACVRGRHCLLECLSQPWLSVLSVGNDAHDVGFFHDDEFFTIDLDLAARPFPKQHPVADFDVERLDFAVVAARAGTGGDDIALHRFCRCGVGDDVTVC